MGITTYFRPLPSLLLSLLSCEFLSSLSLLRRSQNDVQSEEMGVITHLKRFPDFLCLPLLAFEFLYFHLLAFEFLCLPLFAFEFLSPILLLRQSDGHSPGKGEITTNLEFLEFSNSLFFLLTFEFLLPLCLFLLPPGFLLLSRRLLQRDQ